METPRPLYYSRAVDHEGGFVKARLFLLALIATALVAMPAAALGSAAHTSSNSQSFPDSTGEDAQAPDITSTDVSNTDAGMITFKINISNRPALTSDMIILVFLDTDANPATGDPQSLGADYAIQLEPGSVALFKWDGTTFSTAPSQTTLTYAYDATGATIRVGAQDLGARRRSTSVSTRSRASRWTRAAIRTSRTRTTILHPISGHGFYSYAVLIKVTLKASAFTTTPKPAKAGARFTATVAATESDTAGPVTKATITCVASIKGVRLRATHSLANGVASCFWKLPKKAKGKTVTGTITIAAQGATLTKSFRAKIT